MHRRLMLMSLAASAMLSSAFADPGRAQEVSQPPLSAPKLEQILNFVLANDSTNPVNPAISRGLGLAHPFTSRNARFEGADGRYSLAVGVSDPTRLIFLHRTGNAAEARPGDTFYLFATDRRARLLSAGIMVNGVFTPVAIDAARARFEAILRLWEAEPINAQ